MKGFTRRFPRIIRQQLVVIRVLGCFWTPSTDTFSLVSTE